MVSPCRFGALGDSFYEYLIKVWVQGGRSEPMYRRMYDASMAGESTRTRRPGIRLVAHAGMRRRILTNVVTRCLLQA